jgi:FO synthase
MATNRPSFSPSRILQKARNREPLTREEAISLFDFEGEDLEELFAAARSIRSDLFGSTVTLSRNIFIPVTHACRNRCGYCTYREDPKDPESALISPDGVLELAERADALSCREALFMAGDKPERASPHVAARLKHFGFESFFGYACHLMSLVLHRTPLIPHANLGIMTPGQMARLKELNGSIGLMLENVSPRLTLPGEAHYLCPEKYPLPRIRMIQQAGQLRIPFTTGLLIGIGETVEEVVDSLIMLLRLSREGGHIQEIIIQNFGPKPGTPMCQSAEPSFAYLQKVIAVTRIAFDEGVHLQSPPNLNLDRLPGLLKAGIDDFGGVSPLTRDYVNPNDPWPGITVLDRICKDEGLILRERFPVYPEYILSDSGWLPSSIKEKITLLADKNGYAQHESNRVLSR